MNASTIIKTNFLVLGLGLTIYLIYSLNTRGLSPGIKELFGVQSSGPAGQDAKRWNWCGTSSVAAMVRPEHFKISQEAGRWTRENGNAQSMDNTLMQKWFERFCTVLVNPVKTVVDEAFAAAFMVKFSDGKVEVVRRHPNGTYFWSGQTFKSEAFDSALKELESLPAGESH